MKRRRSTCVDFQLGGQRVSFDLRANLISAKVIASHGKCTLRLAKRSPKCTQVFNLRLVYLQVRLSRAFI